MMYRGYKDMIVYKLAYDTALEVFEVTKTFPREEKFSLVDQLRRSSRSVTSNIAEAWGKRMYKNNFISKISDSYSEALETMTWLDYSLNHQYITKEKHAYFEKKYDRICGMLFGMMDNPDRFIIKLKSQ